MRVFISWSGQRSKALAEALRDWLPNVNPASRAVDVVRRHSGRGALEPGHRSAA